MKIELEAFVASNNPSLCDQFSYEHAILLREYGIENVSTAGNLWKYDKNVVVLVARNSIDKSLIGGSRIHIARDQQILPIISALAYTEPKINSWLDGHYESGIAEACGLWNAKRVFGKGISPLLTRSMVAVATKLSISTLIGLAAPYTKDMAFSMGFRTVRELGNDGTFLYPNEKHTASLLQVEDLVNIPNASVVNLSRIKSLKAHPIQTSIEEYNGSKLLVSYNLLL